MTSLCDDAVTQLADAVSWAHGRLLAYHLIDAAAARPRRDPHQWATSVVADLTSDDPHLAAEAAQTAVEWSGPGSHIDQHWWDTPLGLLVAATVHTHGDGPVTQSWAAEALGVDRTTVRRWLDDGMLQVAAERGPTGGKMVDRRSLARLLLERADAS